MTDEELVVGRLLLLAFALLVTALLGWATVVCALLGFCVSVLGLVLSTRLMLAEWQ